MNKKDEVEVSEPKIAKMQELKPKQIWEEGLHENPFEKQGQVLIADTRTNSKGILWVKFSGYLPNVGNQPFEYLTEKDFRSKYPILIPTI